MTPPYPTVSLTDENTDPEKDLSRCPQACLSILCYKQDFGPPVSLYSWYGKGPLKIALQILLYSWVFVIWQKFNKNNLGD